MKHIKTILLICVGFGFTACKKMIDLYPQSNLNTGTYYTSYAEVKAALTGCYNGMQQPLFTEWQFTELRSDNSKMGSPGSTAVNNRDFSDLDIFTPNTAHQAIYNYWQATYYNIRSCNIVLQKLGVVYDPAAGTMSLQNITIPVTDADRKQLAGEAMFIRAYHYFNMVRLFGGVFLVHKPITPDESKAMNRSSADDIYKLIVADLTTAASYMNTLKFNQLPAADLGRATSWAAKGLLAKVYLTLNRKGDAVPLLQDVIANSGYSLQSSYANVFSITNEMNSEILFAVRFKAGGFGLGSPFGNNFGPLGTGSTVINGDGDGLNFPTAELDTLTNGDLRKPTLIARFGTSTAERLYVKKYLFPVVLADDGESDWPVLRYPDILMMLAEAQGYSQASLDLINSVRPRAGLPNYTMQNVTSVAQFEEALSQERRIEFAFENQRWFDLVRFGTTLTTINAVQRIKDHYVDEYDAHYSRYIPPTPTIAELHGNITTARLLLPIPQREIDTNTQLVIPQNPSY
ncbi:MAG: RagB/SusD family nutrient uptake outer membrane protein [Chitinophagaceae bacterium]|nr:RagB/SusD family nutrient uptake outer membrane protein [Chitinophagaceae bacterium]